MNEQLLEYVRKNIEAGYSEETIRETLKSGGGWNDEDIDAAFQAIVPPAKEEERAEEVLQRENVPEPPSIAKILPILAFVLLLPLIIWLLVISFSNQERPQENNKDITEESTEANALEEMQKELILGAEEGVGEDINDNEKDSVPADSGGNPDDSPLPSNKDKVFEVDTDFILTDFKNTALCLGEWKDIDFSIPKIMSSFSVNLIDESSGKAVQIYSFKRSGVPVKGSDQESFRWKVGETIRDDAEPDKQYRIQAVGSYLSGYALYEDTNPADNVSGRVVRDISDPFVLKDCGTESAQCSDTDGGYDVYVKGTVTGTERCIYDGITQDCIGPPGTNTDMCKTDGSPPNPDSGTSILEYFCGADNRLTVDTFKCPKGCIDGACVK